MTKARILANIVSTGSVLADGSVAATGITGAVPIASGGTGATTRQDAINALAGTLTAGHYLRGHDTGVAMSGILAADVPTLNQNTTGSAATLTTPRTISITGDVAYTSGAFDGSTDATGVATLSNSGVTAGTYGSDTNIPQLAVDSKGRVTSVTNVAVSIPSGALTFTGDVTGTGSTGASTALTLTATGTAGTYTKVTTDSKGRVTSGTTLAAGDIPGLDASKITSGTIDAARLPSYVDDVVEATNLAGFPATGETGKIYVALDTNKAYRWSGSAYIYITSGAVDSVAGRTGVVALTSSDVGLGSVENKSSDTIRGEITSTNVTTALGFTPYNSTNPSGYITSSALSSYLPLSGGTLSGKLTINATAGLDLNRLTFDADGTDSFYRALSGNRHRFTTTGGADFIIGNASGAATINGNQVLHAGNYNSYAPTLTGTGASGTWGINVTGYSNYVNRVEAYQWNNATLAAGYNSGIETSFVSAAQDFPNYGVVLSVMGRVPADPGGNFQLFMGHGQSYGGLGLRLRSINQANNAWTSWKILLDESNYTSYAMPAGASATNSVDVRAPIFYDSNDTSFAVDPNATSAIRSMTVGYNGSSYAYDTAASGNLYFGSSGSDAPSYYNISTAMQNYGGNYTKLDIKWYTGQRFYAHSAYGGFRFHEITNNTQIFSINEGGAFALANQSMRSPIFYDSNDTSFYLDPNGTSVLNVLNGPALSDSPLYLRTRGDTNHYLWNAGDDWEELVMYRGTGFRVTSSAGGNVSLYCYGTDNGNYVQAAGSMRAPIFYDSNNTAYYIDAATNSNLATLSISSTTGNTTKLEVSGSTGQLFSVTDSMTGTIFSVNDISGIPSIEVLDTGLVKIAQYSGNVVLGSSADNTTDKLQVNGSVQATTIKASIDARAPLFYDSNDTGYYVDPRSASVLSGLKLNGVDNQAAGADYILWINKPNNNDWAFGITGQLEYNIKYDGASSHLYGIEGLAAGTPYWRVGTDLLYHNSNIRAPIFYDSNDTSYYVDPNSTSYQRSLFLGAHDSGSSEFRFGEDSSGWYGDRWYWDSGFNVYRYSRYAGSDSLIHYHDTRDASRITYGRNIVFDDHGKGIVGYYSSYRYQGVFSMGDAYKLPADGTTTGNLYGIAYSHPNAGGAASNLGSHGILMLENGTFKGAWGGGSLRTPSDVRGTLFYDYDNTSYYVDPATSTSLRTVGDWRADSSSWTGEFAGKIQYHSSTWYLQASSYWIFRNASGTDVFNVNSSGTATAIADFRSQIFYDSNNTGYYLDPNSTSRLNRIDPDEIYNYGWFRNHESNEGMYNQATGQHWYSDSANYWNMGGGVNGQGIRFRDNHAGTVRGYIYYDQGNNIGFLNQDGNWRLRVVGGDYSLVEGSSMRAPLYYDSDNTGYYLDLNSSTRINTINADVINSYGNVTAYASSDQKFKTNIRAIPNALEIVRAVGGKLFDWTDEYLASRGGADGYFLQKSDFGLVAQDLLPHLPQAVKTRQDGTLAVDYEKLCVVAFEAICTLEKRLAAVEQTPLQQNENTLTLLIETVKQQQNQINELKKLLEK